jgi:preprotein translocase subunit SecF
MEFFRDTNIQFMSYRKYWVVTSAALLLVSLFVVLFQGKLNLGIDFAGGTQLTLKFQEEPEVEDLRDLMERVGVGEAQIQRFGAVGANEVLIKTPSIEGSEEGTQELLVSALEQAYPAVGSGPDLNRVGAETLADFLVGRDPDGLIGADPEAARQGYLEAADAVIAVRRDSGLIGSLDELESVPGVSAPALAELRDGCSLGQFSLLGTENVGPQIGSELRQKGVLAVLSSLIGMLIYIWFRFELRFGIGALVAVVHDVMIVLGFYAIAGFEFNLTTVAAFLTLIGYSVNDSVVVFDRVRENLRRSRSRPLVETMNLSINQTLSRTVLTSGTTLLALGCLLFLGGDVLRGFAFILTIGIVVGTYSSIYVASPFALFWEQAFGGAARLRRRESRAAGP